MRHSFFVILSTILLPTAMSETLQPLPAPSADQPYMFVSALQTGTLYTRTLQAIPSLAFYLKHSASDRHFILDLGLRRNFESYPPAVTDTYEQSRPGKPIEVPQDVAESCLKGGVDPATIKNVLLTHLHWDHIGDDTPFTKATFTLGGDGKILLDDGYPENATSTFLSDSTPPRRTVFIDEEDWSTSIGPFPQAVDYFGDGSVYIIRTPDHLAGHITVLARTSPDGAWLYLGGDVTDDPHVLTDPSTNVTTVDVTRARALVRMPRVDFVLAHDGEWAQDNSDAFLPGRIVPKV